MTGTTVNLRDGLRYEIERVCEQCGESFRAASKRARFCTPRCRYRHRDCSAFDQEPTAERLARLRSARTPRPQRRCRACGEPTKTPRSPYCLQHSLEAEERRLSRRYRRPLTAEQLAKAKKATRARERARLSPEQRGYDSAYQRERKRWKQIVAAGGVACWRCHRPIDPAEPWDLGHDDRDRSVIRGPEHRRCNRATASRSRHRRSQRW